MLVGAFLYGKTELGLELNQLKAQETLHASLGSGALEHSLKATILDIGFLGRHGTLIEAADDPSPRNLDRLTGDFINLLHSKKVYDQLRWIDEFGMEKVRVDNASGRPVVVSADQLQHKGDRYFFTETLKLQSGEVFVSPLDLNVEQGKVEEPLKPTLRVATPITDSYGENRGIVILNYYGRELLEAFNTSTASIADHIMLVNGEGYFLKSPNPSDAWGFMFNHPELNLAVRAPVAWARIAATDSGQAYMADGLWTWQTVYPIQMVKNFHNGAIEGSLPKLSEADIKRYAWKTVAHMPVGILSQVQQAIWFKLAGIVALLLGLLGYGTWKLARAGAEQAKAEANLRISNANLETTVAERTNQLQEKVSDLDIANAKLALDILERKTVEKTLQLAAKVFTHAREGIAITDATGSIVEVNDTFTHITGYGHDEALGRNLRMLQSGRQLPEFYVAMWNALREEGYWHGEIWNRRKTGEAYAELLTISAVRDAAGVAQNYVALFSDITPMKEQQQQLERIAHFDALTGLPNRVLLADRMKQAMSQSQRRNQSVAVVYLDLDCFKLVNDAHGHQIGDELLIALSERMKGALREGDTLSRIGGDEFVVVLVDLEQISDSEPVLERLLQAASSLIPVGSLVLQVSASVGVTFYPQDAADADQLMRHADQAMYLAKQAGKNRYHLFDVSQDNATKFRHESFERLRQAMDQHEFVLYYQPKVNMTTGKVIGAEALIRWQHPERGLIAPAEFLPIIENQPISIELGEWVIDTALVQMTEWSAAGLHIPVSVNVSAHQLQQRDFVSRLSMLLAKHPDIQARDLELEVLETSALEDIASVSAIMRACREMGVSFALDDFGTGYSSLTYLKRLPVDMLKIDQSFIRGMLTDPDDLSIVRGVIDLANAFHRKAIAEGVETIAHGSQLLLMGCELAQGYGIARPMPASEIAQWMVKWKPDAKWVMPAPNSLIRGFSL